MAIRNPRRSGRLGSIGCPCAVVVTFAKVSGRVTLILTIYDCVREHAYKT